MFTGIIQYLGKVEAKTVSGGQIRYGFRIAGRDVPHFKIGESIATNGVCLTAARVMPGYFEADVMKETLEATTLGRLRKGDAVNLERSLKYGDEIGGHFVTGHVDGVGRVTRIEKQQRNRLMFFSAPAGITDFLAVKGSLAVDGISLTIQKLSGSEFAVGLIPHTLKVTTLGRVQPGDTVNLEIDLVTRYLSAIVSLRNSKKLCRVTSSAVLKKGLGQLNSEKRSAADIAYLQKQGF